MRNRIPAFLVAFGLLCNVSVRAESGWATDYQKAQEEAKANHKLLLLDFTGSDWCGFCFQLDKAILSQPQFKEYANKNLVLEVRAGMRSRPRSRSRTKNWQSNIRSKVSRLWWCWMVKAKRSGATTVCTPAESPLSLLNWTRCAKAEPLQGRLSRRCSFTRPGRFECALEHVGQLVTSKRFR